MLASLFNHLKVRTKLMLLAGVPVLGTLLLSVLVVRDVQERVRAAAGLGSIETLGQLTHQMLHVIHDLQWERAQTTYAAGGAKAEAGEVARRRAETDEAVAELGAFLTHHDAAKMPASLRQNLNAAKAELQRLPEVRAKVQEKFELLEQIEYFSKINDSLIGATAALTQLSSDKEILVTIGGLVSVMQVIERNAREHALLNYVFGKGEFPPGSFRYLVTLLTEQSIYVDTLRTWSSEAEFTRLEATLAGPSAEKIAAMRQVALETTDEAVNVDVASWFNAQKESQLAFGAIEQAMVGAVRAVAAAKVAQTRQAVRIAVGLVASVTGLSLLLGWAITRSLTRSVRGLGVAAEAVQEKNDYAIRVEKTSNDELGLLTDTFNGMLAGIQRRDHELEAHRQNLEALVAERTLELSERNMEMRLVLDNVAQGLAMLDARGTFLGECSKTFIDEFGQPEPGTPFFRHEALVHGDEALSCMLELGFEQLMADVLPLEVALAQLPPCIVHSGRHYALSFTRITHGGAPTGALLVTRDVTEELLAARAKLEQNERAQVFERIMRDRAGFSEFLGEAGRLMQRLGAPERPERREMLRDLHTLKGITAVFDVGSVSEAAHELEQALDTEDDSRVTTASQRLHARWEQLLAVVRPVLGRDQRQRIEVTLSELREIVQDVQARAPHTELLRSLLALAHEPLELRFERIRDQLTRVARRLNKPEPMVRVQAQQVRLPARTFREFWSSLAHVVRNIVDHGLETEQERLASGKPEQNQIELLAHSDEHGVYIEIVDDGRGIQWARLAEKAAQRGLPHATRADLTRALFADGVSTAEEVTGTSGRGVGMAAVEAACRSLGGSITVDSEPGRGTRFRFVFPPRKDEELAADWLHEGGLRPGSSGAPERNSGFDLGHSLPPSVSLV